MEISELIIKAIKTLISTKEGLYAFVFLLVVYREQVRIYFNRFVLRKETTENQNETDVVIPHEDKECDMESCSLRALGWDELKVFHAPCIYIVKDAQREADFILQVIDFHRSKGVPITFDFTRMMTANKNTIDVVKRLLDDIRLKNSILIKFILPGKPNGTISEIVKVIQNQKEKNESDVFKIKVDEETK